jgi:hypothetical protein
MALRNNEIEILQLSLEEDQTLIVLRALQIMLCIDMYDNDALANQLRQMALDKKLFGPLDVKIADLLKRIKTLSIPAFKNSAAGYIEANKDGKR